MKRFVLFSLGALALVAVGGYAGLWLYAHVIAGLTIRDQPGHVLFPKTTMATAATEKKITIQLNGYIQADVPFKQTLSLPLKGTYDADVRFETDVPLEFTIRYSGAIPVNSVATIQGVTDFNYQKVKRLRNVAFSAEIPLKFEQPIALVVPVKAKIHLVYKGNVKLALDQTLTAPVDTALHTKLLAIQDITTPILSRFGMIVHWPQTPVPVIIKHADLRLPLNTLKLERAQVVSVTAQPRQTP